MRFVREARPEDAEAISALLSESYTPVDGRNAFDHYPFPQLMSPVRLAQMIDSGEFCWWVSQEGEDIVGSFGALRNVRGAEDRIAESFALVVGARWRRRGVASELVGSMAGAVASAAVQWIMAETRTAEAGAAKTFRREGFVPLGFEPFAHNTPVGSEAMLLSGRIGMDAMGRRKLGGKTGDAAGTLARGVLAACGAQPMESVETSAYPTVNAPWARLRQRIAPISRDIRAERWAREDGEISFVVSENNDEYGKRLHETASRYGYHSGIVDLDRLAGENIVSRRYVNYGIAALVQGSPVASARVAWDRADKRARVWTLSTLYDGLQGVVLGKALAVVETNAASAPCTVVVDVRADRPGLQATLSRLGFIPTVYYPALLADGEERLDAVQFMHLMGRSLDGCWPCLEQSAWEQVSAVAEAVRRASEHNR